MEKFNLLGLQVSAGTYQGFVDRILEGTAQKEGQYVCVANVHMLVEAHYDDRFAGIVNGANLTAPDGMPLSWAMRWLYGITQDRVAGMDLLPDLLKEAESRQIPVYFYGGSGSMLKKTALFLNREYPKLKVAGMSSPPFRALWPEEEQAAAQDINRSGARLVFVVLGCPKQERWMAAMKRHINAVMIGVGGALPVMLGFQQRAPLWMQKAGLEWLYRLVQEPARLFRRYAVTNTVFLLLLLKALIRFRPSRRRPLISS